jgi:hypothetical protein
MKLDKENLIKNRFWILAGTAATLTVIGLLLLLFTAPSAVAEKRDAIEKSWKGLKNQGTGFKHPDYLKMVQAEAQKFKAESNKSLSELYKSQVSQSYMMTWPKAMVDEGYDFNNGKFADEVVVHKRDAKGDAKSEEKALKAQPADTETKISGILVATEQNWIKIKDRKDQVIQIMRGPNTKVVFKDVVEKKTGLFSGPTFGDLGNKMNQVVEVTFKVGRWFGEDFTDQEVKKYRDTYGDQLPETLAEVGPLNFLKEPMVQLRYLRAGKAAKVVSKDLSGDTWIYLPDRPDRYPPEDNLFFSYVGTGGKPSWPQDFRRINTDEIWAAQENVWVEREIYKRIRLANESVAAAERSTDPKDSKDGWSKFRNFYWEMDFKVTDHGEKAKVAVRLKNLRPQYQSVNNLRFLLRFKDPNDKNARPSDPVLVPPVEPVSLRFEGNWVDPADSGKDTFPAKGASQDFVEFPIIGPVAEIFSVEQMLTVETAAVKRLDIVTIGVSSITGETAVSHYDAGRPTTSTGGMLLVSFKKKPVSPTAVAANTSGAPGADDQPKQPTLEELIRIQQEQQAQQQDQQDPSQQSTLDLGKAADFIKLSSNNLVIDRYLTVKYGEFRQLPVSVVMVVGPDHVNRVLASLASSPLRFLTRQMLWQRCQLSTGGAVAKTAPTAGAPSGGIGEGQENIELTVYGILTLYDRPGRPPEPVAPAAPLKK